MLLQAMRLAGDVPGHEFHGNQWMAGGSSGASPSRSEAYYHGTSVAAAKKIKQEGLKSDHLVWVAPDERTAVGFGWQRSEKGNFAVVVVKKTPEMADLLGDWSGQGQSFLATRGAIPPEAIVEVRIYNRSQFNLADAAWRMPKPLRTLEEGALYLVIELPEDEIRTAGKHESAIHKAADAHVAKLSVAIRYAFAMGRKALRGSLKTLGDVPGHEFHGNQWTDTPAQRPDGGQVVKTPATGSIAERRGLKIGSQVSFHYRAPGQDVGRNGSGYVVGFIKNVLHVQKLGSVQDVVIRTKDSHVFVAEKNVRGSLRSASHSPDISSCISAIHAALLDTLPATLLKVVAAGGDAGLEMLKTKLRAASKFKLASTQVNLPPSLGKLILDLGRTIPDDDLAADGRETEPHVTVKYGLLNDDPEPVQLALVHEMPLTLTLGETSCFEGVEHGTADAVIVKINSADLVRLNRLIANSVGCAPSDHGDYVPHATIAYVKLGLGARYAGNTSLVGKQATIDHIVVLNKDGSFTKIPLGLRAAELRTLKPSPGPFKFRFDAKNKHVIDWADKHAAELITGITETTRENINNAVAELQETGDWQDSYDEILAAVGDTDRADLIARHETMLAANEGQRQGWDQAVDDGLLTGDEKRVWIATEDDRICPICEELDGTKADIDGVYEAGGEEYDGPPAHVQCRCTEGIV